MLLLLQAVVVVVLAMPVQAARAKTAEVVPEPAA
jgi:hypothetical protein